MFVVNIEAPEKSLSNHSRFWVLNLHLKWPPRSQDANFYSICPKVVNWLEFIRQNCTCGAQPIHNKYRISLMINCRNAIRRWILRTLKVSANLIVWATFSWGPSQKAHLVHERSCFIDKLVLIELQYICDNILLLFLFLHFPCLSSRSQCALF